MARFSLALLAVFAAEAIQLEPAGQLEPEKTGFNPSLDEYTKIWGYRYGLEQHLQEPMSPSIRMVLAVMSVPQDVEYRKVIRRTWLNQSGVCYWSRQPQADCSVYVAFVIGQNGTGKAGVPMSQEEQARAREEPGMYVLPITENADEGKTMVWFREARDAFPWATHFGKTDVDTYPYLHKLVHRLAENRSCVGEGSDFELVGRPHRFCSRSSGCSDFTQACRDVKSCFGDFTNPSYEKVPSGGPFRFLLGEFYAMSASLVRAVDWEPKWGKEDEEVSVSVNATAARLKKCVAVRRLDISVHAKRGVNARFANDFQV